jgi:hypothetical protein
MEWVQSRPLLGPEALLPRLPAQDSGVQIKDSDLHENGGFAHGRRSGAYVFWLRRADEEL